MNDQRYIRPEDRLWYAASALKSPSTTKPARDRYLTEAEQALAEMRHDPTVPSHKVAPIRHLEERGTGV